MIDETDDTNQDHGLHLSDDELDALEEAHTRGAEKRRTSKEAKAEEDSPASPAK